MVLTSLGPSRLAAKASAPFSRKNLPPDSIEDFLGGEARKNDNTDNRKTVNTANEAKLRRFELKLPEELAEKLHHQAFKGNTTKTAIVIAALSRHLEDLERR